MPLLTVADLHHSYGLHVVLDGATLSIDPGEKIGLVGRNGCGKTTLMKIILGQMTPDSGSVQLQRGARIGYLSQDPSLPPEESVRDAAEGAFEHLHALHQQLHTGFEQMAGADEAGLKRLMRTQSELESAIETAGGYVIDHKIDAMLHGLGFADADFNILVKNLSGGQKGRLGLAKLLLQAPDLLLLDEPTNHLDIAGRQWLEEFLAEEYPGAVLMVSHDRWLLDRVVRRIIEVDRGSIWEYPGNYHSYIQLRRERMLTQSRAYEKQADRIRSEQQFIDRYRAGQRAKQARGRESRLERFKRDELLDRPTESDVMRLTLPPAPRSGEQVAVAQGISKTYGERVLFSDLDLTIARGDRIGVIGPNGVGKTTLVRCLLGELEPDRGSVRLGSRVNVGYYQQSQEHLDLTMTVWQYLQSVIVGLDGQTKASEQQARDLAGAFLFSGDEQDKPLSLLSGGERSRAVLAGLVAGARNLLVLDEPTNHLDIPSAERLEWTLSATTQGAYEGTLMLISHDRALLEATCTKLIIFDGSGTVREFTGRYSEWVAKQRAEAEAKTAAKPGWKPAAPRRDARKQRAESATQRKVSRQVAALTKLDLKALEGRIEVLQKQINGIDQQMMDPAVYENFVKCEALTAQRAALQGDLEPLEFEWARRAAEA